MSKMLDALKSSINPISVSNFDVESEEKPNFLARQYANRVSNAMNYAGGLLGNISSLLKGAGVMANFGEQQRIEENARQLENMGLHEQANEYRKNPGKGAFSVGNEIVNNGEWLSDITENINKKYGSKPEYEELGLLDRLTNWDYLTDTRGLQADAFQGLGSSTLSLLALPFAPEVTLASKALATAGKYAPKLLGDGLTAASKNTIGTTLDNVLGYGLNPLAAPFDAFANAGENVTEHRMQGRKDADIAPIIGAQTLNEVPYDMLNQGIFGVITGGRLFAPAKKRAGRIAQQAAGIPIEMTSEYFQEGTQQRLSNEYLGKPYGTWYAPTEDEKRASAMGAIGSILTAGAGAAKGAYQNWNLPQAEGFDSNNFEKWESKPGATDLDGVRPEIKGALNSIAKELGNDGKITITGGAEKGYHAEGEFGHEGGWKIDIDKGSIKDPQKFFNLCEKYGIAVGDEGDHYDLSAHKNGSTGGNRVATPNTFLSDMLSGQNTIAGEREGHENAWAVYDVFKNAGYSDNAIAGILGRLQQEHNFNTDMAEEKDVEGIGRVGGYGMFQWQLDPEHGGRGNAFLKWAKDNNLDPQNATVQAQYALLEAQQRGLTPEKMNKLTAEDAATLWTDEWEVGKHGDERKYANEWAERIARGGSAGTKNNTSNNNVDTSFVNNTEKAQDNSALIQQLNAIMAEGEPGLSREQRLALLNMAREEQQIPLQNATAAEEEDYYRAIGAAIDNEDYKALAQMFPQQAAEILGIKQPKQSGNNSSGILNGVGALNNNALKTLSHDAFNNVFGTNISPERFKAELNNIRDMHHKQMLQEEASAGRLPTLKRIINTDLLQAANNMGTSGGVQGKNGFERGIIGSTLEKALNGNDPNLKRAAENVIRQIQSEDEASYFNGDVSVMQGVGQSRKSVIARTKDGLTAEAAQKYNSPDWATFAQREGYQPTDEVAPHIANLQTQTGGILSGIQAQPAENVIETSENDVIEDISADTQNGLLSGAFNLGKALNSYNAQNTEQRLNALGLGTQAGNPADIILPGTNNNASLILPEHQQQAPTRQSNPFNVTANTSPVFRKALQEGNLDVAIDEAERMQDYNTAETLKARKAILEGMPVRGGGLTATQQAALELLRQDVNQMRENEQAKANETAPAPTVKKYHFDGTQNANQPITQETEVTEPISQAEGIQQVQQIQPTEEKVQKQSKKRLKPMREMYDNRAGVFENFNKASEAVFAGYEEGYIGKAEAEEFLQAGYNEFQEKLHSKQNKKAFEKFYNKTLKRLERIAPKQAQETEPTEQGETTPIANEEDNSGLRKTNELAEQHKELLAEYRSHSLAELEARRERYIKERVDYYNANPGGKGVTTTYYDENGIALGQEGAGYNVARRETVSNNPEWYQRAYELLGRRPAKKDYEYIADVDLSEWQPYEVRIDWQALNDVIEEKQEEERIKAEPKNVQKFKNDISAKVKDFKKGIKGAKDKEASRDNYLGKLKELRDKAVKVAKLDDTRAAMDKAYNEAVEKISRAYDDATAKNTQNAAQAGSARNEPPKTFFKKKDIEESYGNSYYAEFTSDMPLSRKRQIKNIKNQYDNSIDPPDLSKFHFGDKNARDQFIKVMDEQLLKFYDGVKDAIENGGKVEEKNGKYYLYRADGKSVEITKSEYDYGVSLTSQAQDNPAQTKKAAENGGQENAIEASNTTSDKNEVGDDVNNSGEKTHTDIVREKLLSQKNQDIVNQDTGIKASFGIKGINKMLSNTAVNKSIRNGFTRDEHLDAVADIWALFEKAKLYKTTGDEKNNSSNLKSVKRFISAIDDRKYAYITVKESVVDGHRIYSLELQEINNAPSDTGKPEGSTYSNGASVDSTIPQTEPTGKDKNSAKQETTQQERSQNEDAFYNGNKNITASYSDKGGDCRGTVKNGTITVWRKDGFKKSEWSFNISLDEINKVMKGNDNPFDSEKPFKDFYGKRISGGNANINYLWRTISISKVRETNERWIENSKTEKLKDTRRKYYEESGGKDAIHVQDLADSAARVMRNLYEQTQGARLNQDTRGIYDTTNKIITLMESADESTFMHEMSHHYLNELEQIAEITGENSQAARDLQEINKWANWKDEMAAEYEDTASEKEFAELEKEILSAEEKGDTKKAEELKERWKQERFARGVEEYLSEGIAPTAKLKKIFDNFKNWLKEIYRGLRGAGAKPSDDVRAVMERMFASDKEILSGRASRLTGETKAAYDKALADLKAAGVKNAEADAYLAAKMAERLKTAYEEKGQSVSVLSLLPEIRAQEKSTQNEKEAVRKKYEGTKKWLKAPNGEDTNLTEEQWLTVRTSAFKKWFGDWENDPANASKVVDENGEPLVVYHSSSDKFDIFNKGGIFHFGTKTQAEMRVNDYKEYLETTIIDLKEQIKDTNSQTEKVNLSEDLKNKEKQLAGFQSPQFYQVFLNIKNMQETTDENEWETKAETARALGYDGMTYYNVYENDGNNSFAVFNSNQIKSATDNNGEFDANDPSILHQKSSKSPIEENVGMGDNVINDYLTIKSNGSFAVKLLREKPPLRTETQQERIHRRKEEVSNMDKLLDLKNNPDAYAELLSGETVNAIERRLSAEQISYDELVKKFLIQYNSNVAKYSEIVEENKVIGSLYVLKGAMRYVEQRGNIARRNKSVGWNERNAGRNLSEMGRNDTKATSGQLNTEAETQKHSKTGAFSIAEKDGKFNVELNTESLGKSKLDNLKTLVDSYNGKISDKGVSFTFDDKSTLDKFMLVSEAYLSTTDEDTKAKASIDAWHGNGLYELIDKFSLKFLGTGEGAQVHGWGLYFAKSRKVGERYKLSLSERDKIQYAGNEYIKKDSGWECVNGELQGEYFYKGEPYAKILDILADNVDKDTNEIKRGSAGLFIDRLWEDATITRGKKAKEEALIYNQAKNVVLHGNVAFIKGSGHLYHVQIPDKKYMLDENKSFTQQSKTVQNAIKKMLQALPKNRLAKMAMLRSVPNYENLSQEELIQEYIDYIDAEDFGGCLYYDLSLNPQVATAEDPKAASLLLNKYGIKGITYDGRRDGRCYVVFDDNAVEIIEKFSAEKLKENAIAKLAANAKIINAKDLTTAEKKFTEMGDKLGTPVVWVDADPRLNGWHKDGVTFINRNRRMSGEKTFWHESLHFIVQNEEELLGELAEAVNISGKQIEAWKDKTGRYELSDNEVVEEMLCDAFHDPASRVKVFQEIAGKNPSLMEKIMAWINRLKEQFFDVFKGVQGGLTQSQKNNMTRVIDKHFKNLKGKDGKPLFRRKGNEWILANGESLDNRIAASGQGENRAKSPIENSDNLSDNKKRRRYSLSMSDKGLTRAGLTDTVNGVEVERQTNRVAENGDIEELFYRPSPIEEPEERYNRRLQEVERLDVRFDEGVSENRFVNYIGENKRNYIRHLINDVGHSVNNMLRRFKEEFALTLKVNDIQNENETIKRLYILEGSAAYAKEYGRGQIDERRNEQTSGDALLGGQRDTSTEVAEDSGRDFQNLKQNSIRPTSRTEQGGFSNAQRTTAELKEEVKEAFPNATEIEETEGGVILTMPNGMKMTVNIKGEITVSDEELADAKEAHNIASDIEVTIEGYEETVDGGAFVALSKGSREGTGFHEAYHVAEELVFTDKEKKDAKRLISPNDEVRADTFAGWKLDRKKGGNFAKLWRKIADFAARMASLAGYETKRSLFLKVESGEMYERGGNVAQNGGRKYSATPKDTEAEQSFLETAAKKLAKKMGLKSDKVIVEAEKKDPNDIDVMSYLFHSPSRIKGTFDLFYQMGKKAMDTLTKNRSDFSRKLDRALDSVKTDEEKQALYDVLLKGDAEQKEFSREELTKDHGENVAKAYFRVRNLMKNAYKMLNDARRKPVMWTKRYTGKELDELRDNKFVEIKSVGALESDGRRKVTYKEYQNYKHEGLVVDKETLDRFENDENMQVYFKRDNGDGTFMVSYREGIGNLNELTGYIPHFFHNYMIRVKDGEGNIIQTIGSGRTEREAVKKAEEWLKNHNLEKGQEIYVSPKTFDFTSLGMDESKNAAVMGDKDYKKMLNAIAEGNDLTLGEAKDLLNGSVKMKNRHRFLGNLLHRKGVEGYETDLPWVLRHYVNSVARYHALETEFKPQAISLFERLFGDFNKDHKGLANYVKEYISDINGNPSALEEILNKTFRNNVFFRNFITPYFGDRAALQLSNTITNWTSMLCLGYLNTSSALLNLSQCMNVAGYLGSPKYAGLVVKEGFKPKYGAKDMKILLETNVLNDIGLDSGSGYDMNRGYAGKAFGMLGKLSQKGMILFKTTEQAMRRGAVLTAYKKAVAEGKTHKQAIAYAKEINDKSNFDYGVADAPNIFRRGSVISQIVLQFKKYGFKELEVMADMLGKSTDYKQKLTFWGMYFLACGLLQIPAFDWLDKLLGEDMKPFVQKSIMEVCGDSAIGRFIGRTAMYGVLSNMGVDISARAGMADVIPTNASNLAGASVSRMTGIASEGGKLALSLVSDNFQGDVPSLIKALSPGMYNIYSAAAGEKIGKRGRATSYYETAWERILRGLGFQSTDERISSDMERIVTKERSGLTKKKQDAVDAFIANPTTANAKRLKELGISPKTVKEERERKKQDRAGRMEGRMNKEEQKRYKEMMKFAE